MSFSDETDLLNQLLPEEDGLILREQGLSSTFLPSVWDSLSQKEEFLAQLKLKAGLPKHYWSDTIHFFRYKTEYIKE